MKAPCRISYSSAWTPTHSIDRYDLELLVSTAQVLRLKFSHGTRKGFYLWKGSLNQFTPSLSQNNTLRTFLGGVILLPIISLEGQNICPCLSQHVLQVSRSILPCPSVHGHK